MEALEPDRPVVLFDGVCNLCNQTVQFIIDRDPTSRFRFAALQSETAAALLAPFGRQPPEEPQSILLLSEGRLYESSTAVLRIAAGLRRPWAWLGWLRVVPRPLRDALYRCVARSRYRWFGRSESCRLPTPELRARFL